jgi:hypothetical protein
MITPDEHRRNLSWTTSTLNQVIDRAPEGSELRERATRLHGRIPSLDEIEGLDHARPEQVEAPIDTIEAAREGFMLAMQQLQDPKLRRSLAVTLRHYPRAPDFSHWRRMLASGAPMGGVLLRKNLP